MKKTIITTFATAMLALGALAQGSMSALNATGIYFDTGVGDQSSGPLYVGALNLALYFSTSATAGQITAIDNNNGVDAVAAMSALAGAGFVQVATATGSAGADSQITGFPGTIDLPNNFAPNASGAVALVFTEGSLASVYAATALYGGDPNATPTPGTPYSLGNDSALTSYFLSKYMDLTPVPEPATLAFAGLGGLSLLLFRRKQA